MSGFDLFSLLTGGGSGRGDPPKPPAGPAKPAAPALSPEAAALANAQRTYADLQRRQEGYVNQAQRSRVEAKALAMTNRARARQLLESAKASEASAEALGPRIRDLAAQIGQLERGMGIAAHARVTREMQSALSTLTSQIDMSAFEDTREAMHEATGELDEFDDIVRNPIGVSGDEARMTPSERTRAIDQELDDLVNGDAVTELDALPSLEPLRFAPATGARTASPAQTRVAVAVGAMETTATTTAAAAPRTPPPVASSTASAQANIAKRLADARAAAAANRK
jgi:hypothetical protein